MFIKAMFNLWVIIQSGTCLSADLNNSDICWIKGVVIAKLKKNIRCITVLSTLNDNLHNKDNLVPRVLCLLLRRVE